MEEQFLGSYNDLQVKPTRILEAAQGMWKAQVLSTAVELGLFDYLAQGPRHKEEICKELGIKAIVPEDFLDALVSMGDLDKSKDGKYSNAQDIQIYCVKNSPLYIGPLVQFRGKTKDASYNRLTEYMKSNEILEFNWDKMYLNEESMKNFSDHMISCIRFVGLELPRLYYFKSIKTFADVGGCSSYLSQQIIK